MSEPTVNQILSEPSTRIKINPETYMKFDGSEMLLMKNAFDEKALQFKYDIMLLLYDMVTWQTIGDLLAPWPPEDQQKIIEYLGMMYESKVIITAEGDIEALPESGLTDQLGKNIHINVENHHNMLKDHVRMEAYRRAIEKTVKDDHTVLDLGCGSGVLGFFACQAGAKKVYGIEKQPHVALIAEELARRNGFNQVEIMTGSSTQISSDKIEPKADVLVSEIIGNAILEENIIEFTVDARDRFLADGGKLIPWKLDIYLFGFHSSVQPEVQFEVDQFKDLYNIDFGLLSEVLHYKTHMRLDRYQPMTQKTMTETVLAKSLNFYEIENPFFNLPIELTPFQDGEITHYCAYFKAHMDEHDTILTNSPWAPQTHWTQVIFRIPYPEKVKAGEKVSVNLVYDGSLRLFTPDQL